MFYIGGLGWLKFVFFRFVLCLVRLILDRVQPPLVGAKVSHALKGRTTPLTMIQVYSQVCGFVFA